MKRQITSILCSILFIGAFAQANIQMRVVPKFIEPGEEEVELEFEMINPDQVVSTGNMNIYLPEGITVMKEDDDYLIEMNSSRLPKTGKHEILGAYQTDGSFKISFMSLKNKEIVGTEGTLFSLFCKVSEDAATGLLPVTLKDIVLVWGEGSDERFDESESTGYIRVAGEESASLTIPEGGFGTLCLPFDAELKDGMKAYAAIGVEDNTVIMEEKMLIEANTPLVISGLPGIYVFKGNNSLGKEAAYTVGVLTGCLFPKEYSEGYVLQNQQKGLGFYKLASTRIIPSYRCLLNEITSNSNAPFFMTMDFDANTTDIDKIVNGSETINIYNVDGLNVRSLSKGNVYIVNGKKIIIK